MNYCSRKSTDALVWHSFYSRNFERFALKGQVSESIQAPNAYATLLSTVR